MEQQAASSRAELTGRLARHGWQLTDALLLNLLAVAVGAIAALFAYAFRATLFSAGDWLRGEGARGQFGWLAGHPWVVLALPPLGGLIVGLLLHAYARQRRFRGITAVIESAARRGGRLRIRNGAVELLASWLSIASGMSVGMEGPIAVGGAVVGSNVARAFRLSAARRRTLLGCGAAAGISAVFNAPLAGFFFVIELILGDYTKRAVAAIVLASVSANVTVLWLTGNHRIFSLPPLGLTHPLEMLNYLLLGLVCGLAAYLFAQLLLYCELIFPRWRVYPPLKPLAGGLACSAIALFFPEVLGGGYGTINALLNSQYPGHAHLLPGMAWAAVGTGALVYLVLLGLAKIAATSLSLGSGAAGGEFAPSLFIGASLGGAFGVMAHAQHLVPTQSPGAYALAGMAAIFGAIAQAPIASILLAFEMTGNYQLILPLLATGAVSHAVFHALRREGVFTHKLARLGVKFGRGKDLNILEAIPVVRAMHRGVETIPVDAPLDAVRALLERTEHRGFPVVDLAGRICGVLTVSDLARAASGAPEAAAQPSLFPAADGAHESPATRPTAARAPLTAGDICTRAVLTLSESDNCGTATALMDDHNIGRLPVVNTTGQPIGIITRSDIVGAYKLAVELRQREGEED